MSDRSRKSSAADGHGHKTVRDAEATAALLGKLLVPNPQDLDLFGGTGTDFLSGYSTQEVVDHPVRQVSEVLAEWAPPSVSVDATKWATDYATGWALVRARESDYATPWNIGYATPWDVGYAT